MDKKYYTVAEFAKIVGVTRQTVYKKMATELTSFCKEINGQKMISYQAFSKFAVNDLQDAACKVNVTSDNNLTEIIRIFDKQLSEQYSQITEKDLQLTRKDEQIEKLQEQIAELTKAFREAQALHAGTMQRELTDNTTTNNKHRWWKFWQKEK